MKWLILNIKKKTIKIKVHRKTVNLFRQMKIVYIEHC